MTFSRRLEYDPIRSIDSATFTGSYQAIGTPLSHASSIIKIVNTSSVNITISTDGSTDQDIVPSNGFFVYDVTTNSPSTDLGVFVPKLTQYYVKGAASVGLVYLVVQFVRLGP